MIVKMGLENKMDQSKFPLPSSEKLQKSFLYKYFMFRHFAFLNIDISYIE